MKEPLTPSAFPDAFVELGALFFAFAGFCLLLKAKPIAAKFMLLGVGTILLDTLGPEALDGVPFYSVKAR